LAGYVLSVLLGVAPSAAWGKAAKPTPEDLAGWPIQVKGHVPPRGEEHPRLLFRRSDLPALRARARTAEGQALIRRLRIQLNGGDGETMPQRFGAKGPVNKDGAGPHADSPPGMYTMSHAAGYGLLYLLTEDKKYADLGRKCMDLALEGQRDRDQRYSFRAPYGALRAGPSLGWTALGYDLCYDGWDEAYRRKIAAALADYNEGQWCSLPELTRGDRQHPGSNHWGMEVGGAAMALLAIRDDPGVDMSRIAPLIEASRTSMIINMTQGFGDGGFFAEGDGTGSMSSHIVFLPALQAWRTAAGLDFVSPRPNAQWMALKWFFLTVPRGGGKMDFPGRGGYPHNIWARHDKSGGGYFSIAMGVCNDDQRSAMLWFYNRHLREVDDKNQTPLDAATPYPHHTILSLANWPMGGQEKDPDRVLPHACRDTKWHFYAWRNRWQDQDDIVISILTRASKGNMGARGEGSLTIFAMGKKMTWGNIRGGFVGEYAPKADGSTVLSTGDGGGLAIDFSRASGADGMIVQAGPAAGKGTTLEAGGQKFSFLFLTKGPAPQPKVEGDKIVVGQQTVGWDGKRMVLGK